MPDDPGDDTGFPAPEALEKGPLVRWDVDAGKVHEVVVGESGVRSLGELSWIVTC